MNIEKFQFSQCLSLKLKGMSFSILPKRLLKLSDTNLSMSTYMIKGTSYKNISLSLEIFGIRQSNFELGTRLDRPKNANITVFPSKLGPG